MDFRVDRMKRIYCDSLLELAETTPLGKINVTMLVKAAGTARQTFYNHFHDVNDLIAFLPINYLMSKSAMIHDFGGVRAAYTYAMEHKAFFRQLPYHDGQNNFRESFIMWLEESYYEQYITNEMTSQERIRRMLAIDLYVSGVTCQFLEWCKADFSWPLETLLAVQEEALPPFARE